VVLAVLSTAVAAPSGRQTPVFRSRVDVVSLDVVVQRGRTPVMGLTADDFEIQDNGVRQRVDAVAFESRPIDVTLVVDRALFRFTFLGQPREQIAAMAALLRPVDRIGVMDFGADVAERVPIQASGEPLPIDLTPSESGRSFYDATAAALLRPRPLDRRQLVVTFTGGVDDTSVLDLPRVRDVARRSDAVLYLVLDDSVPSQMRMALGEMAELTGGGVRMESHLSRPLRLRFREIFDEFRQSYVLTYRPVGVSVTGWHEVRVSLPSRPDLTVRVRAGYLASD
jgi:VWFA-related protein